MTIECYYSKCKYHGTNSTPSDEGPFCFQSECKASNQELKLWALERKLEKQGYEKHITENPNPSLITANKLF